MVFAHFTTLVSRLKTADDWRNDETMAGGDAFFEEVSTGFTSRTAWVLGLPMRVGIDPRRHHPVPTSAPKA